MLVSPEGSVNIVSFSTFDIYRHQDLNQEVQDKTAHSDVISPLVHLTVSISEIISLDGHFPTQFVPAFTTTLSPGGALLSTYIGVWGYLFPGERVSIALRVVPCRRHEH